MFLARPEHTPYDLRWTMFGTPIRVHPFFWILCAILGWSFMQLGFEFLLIWIACAFVSILWHEFGHVWMGQVYGARGEIVLYSFGGLAFPDREFRKRYQRIAVFAAGPGIQLILFAVLWVVREQYGHLVTNEYLQVGLYILYVINIYWALLNLIPIWPLDGGQISRELIGYFAPRKATKLSLQLSIILAVLIAVHAVIGEVRPENTIPYLPTGYYIAIVFAMITMTNIQALQAESERDRWMEDRMPWE